jgi:hypothetical protein
MENVSNKSCGEHQNTHSMFSNFFPKILLFVRGQKYSGAREAAYVNMVVHCMLDK